MKTESRPTAAATLMVPIRRMNGVMVSHPFRDKTCEMDGAPGLSS